VSLLKLFCNVDDFWQAVTVQSWWDELAEGGLGDAGAGSEDYVI
jgi:hypothetical protein